MMQQLVKIWLRQSELGIRAMRLFLTRYCIQHTNAGIEKALIINNTILDALWILLISADNDLEPVSLYLLRHLVDMDTYAKIYDSIASPALANSTPTQSISEPSRFQID